MQVKKNDSPIKDVLKQFVHQNKINKGFHTAQIKSIWKEKMGKTINNYTTSIRLDKKCLYVNIDSSPLKHELSMGKSKIINLINEEIGENVIDKIEFR